MAVLAAGAVQARSIAPAPAPDTAPAAEAQTPPAVEETPPVAPVESAATTFSVSGTVNNAPPGATVTVTFNGAGGTFSATADGSGNYSVSGLPAGDYTAIGEWTSPLSGDTGASAAQRFGTVVRPSWSTVTPPTM